MSASMVFRTNGIEFLASAAQLAHLEKTLREPNPVISRDDFQELRLTLSWRNTLRVRGTGFQPGAKSVHLFVGWMAHLAVSEDERTQFERVQLTGEIGSWTTDGAVELRYEGLVIMVGAVRAQMQEAA